MLIRAFLFVIFTIALFVKVAHAEPNATPGFASEPGSVLERAGR